MSAPWPVGDAQNPPTAQEMLAYLDSLGTWIDDSRRQLDRLDQKLQETGNGPGVQDLSMTLTVWQAIRTRYQDLLTTWDSGRVTEVDLKKLAVLTWSNLNDMLAPGASISSGGGLALSLPEACRMLDALVAQLSSRYQLVTIPTQTSARITALLAQMDRIHDQAQLDPAPVRALTDAPVADLAAAIKDLVDKADRGGDVGGLLGPVEVRAAQMERDLIVTHAERQMLGEKIAQAQTRRESLIYREKAVLDLVAKTRASVDPAPKYAVPHVESLGEVPDRADLVDAYLARLDQVSAALDIVQQANEEAYALIAALVSRLEKAQAVAGPGADPVRETLVTQVNDLLHRSPVPVQVVEPLIRAVEASGRPS
ncbi:MAG: hypothetical protein FWD75_02970 [Propionibacteriaceae bacterium]|nr:hypothetical protein [Propionibacteriaceae bacterium]